MCHAVLSTIVCCVVCSFLACVITVFLMRNTEFLKNNQCSISVMRRGPERNQRTPKFILLKNTTSVKDGAVCLDGSPPGYSMKKGYGNGINSWIIYFNGGAWCYDEEACYQRSQTKYGSTRYISTDNIPHNGMYSDNQRINPDFYNWNMIFIIYCDGSSFTGRRRNPVHFKGKTIYLRGKIILDSIIEDLLDNRGLRKAREVLLSGSSAGSLAVLIHADYIQSRLPQTTKVRAIADSGFFVDMETHYGVHKLRERFQSVLTTHNSSLSLHTACTKRTNEYWKCVFPEYFFDLIKTKVFVLQSAYDVWQIIYNLAVICTIPNYHDLVMFNNAMCGIRVNRAAKEEKLNSPDSTPILSDLKTLKDLDRWHWQGLYSSPAECTTKEIHEILKMYNRTLEALRPVWGKKGSGLFLSPCFEHSQARYDMIWNKVKIKGKTIKEAIHEWYFEESENNFHIGEELSFASCVR